MPYGIIKFAIRMSKCHLEVGRRNKLYEIRYMYISKVKFMSNQLPLEHLQQETRIFNNKTRKIFAIP